MVCPSLSKGCCCFFIVRVYAVPEELFSACSTLADEGITALLNIRQF
jgi:hypothetical protein